MTAKQPRNPNGLTLRAWIRAAGWEALYDERVSLAKHHGTFDMLSAAWTNGVDPAEYLSTAPKSVHDLIAFQHSS